MPVVKWIIDGRTMERNPDRCVPRPQKRVTYDYTIEGRVVRLLPFHHPIEQTIEIGFHHADQQLRNFFHDLFVQDKAFWIQTNVLDPRDKWKVKIDEFDPPYLLSGENQRFDLSMVLRVISDPADPILAYSINRSPYPILVNNAANIPIRSSTVILQSIDRDYTLDFVGKIAGNTSVPHVAYSGFMSSLLPPQDATWQELTQGNYDAIEADDAALATSSTSTSGQRAAHMFVFSLSSILNGDISKIASYTYALSLKWEGYGSGSDGGATPSQAFGVSLYAWAAQDATPSWVLLGSHSANVPQLINIASLDLSRFLSADGKLYVSAISDRAAGGTIASAVSTDYVNFSATVNSLINPSFTAYYGNLFTNADFEAYDGSGNVTGWTYDISQWFSDFAFYYQGMRAMRSHVTGASLYQDVFVVGNETLAVGFYARQKTPVANGFATRITFYDTNGTPIGSPVTIPFTLTSDYAFYTVTTATPSGAYKARIEFYKNGGQDTDAYSVYVDNVICALAGSLSEWFYVGPQSVTYTGVLTRGDTLRVDLDTLSAIKNGTESVRTNITGSPIYFPVGKSILVFTDDVSSTHQAQLVLRYEEVYA